MHPAQVAAIEDAVAALVAGTGKPGIRNCHVRGLDSVVLRDGPRMVRMFVAHPNHELWRNHASILSVLVDRQTLALHPHHCDVTLRRVMGTIVNYTAELVEDPRGVLQECAYLSAIKDGVGALVPTGRRFRGDLLSFGAVRDDPGTFMLASAIHCVWVPRGASAAWTVSEGQEDPAYVQRCYTQTPTFDQSGMYQPMTVHETLALLTFILDATR